MTGVTLNGAIKRYGEVQVIHGIDLQVEDGEFCVFVGPSGCGKSTLLRMIAGLEETTEGQINIGTRDVTRADPSERGVDGQSGGIMSWRAERLQNMRSFAKARGEDPNQASPQTQAMFFLQEDSDLVQRLNSAKSTQEAQQLMDNAWRFAGYNRNSPEVRRRLTYANQFLPDFKGSSATAAADQMAGATLPGFGPSGAPNGSPMMLSPTGQARMNEMGGGGVQVASLDPAAGMQQAFAAQEGAQPVQQGLNTGRLSPIQPERERIVGQDITPQQPTQMAQADLSGLASGVGVPAACWRDWNTGCAGSACAAGWYVGSGAGV